MKKIAVVYWSGTGNTKAMAEAVAEGIDNAGAESVVLKSAEFSAEDVVKYDSIAFGCPSMGVEQLEESEFELMFINCEPHLKAKNIALFGSYDWGDGEWMRTWEETCREDGAVLVCDSVICNDMPDSDAVASCRTLGAALAK